MKVGNPQETTGEKTTAPVARCPGQISIEEPLQP